MQQDKQNEKTIFLTGILCFVFFLSGASALIFELLWFKLAGLTFGNSVWATALVLSGFMGGLALGSGWVAFKGHRIEQPLRFYALLEVTIAVFGFFLVLIFPRLTQTFLPAYRVLSHHPFLLNSFRTIAAFILLVLPAGAMGATLPLLVKALYKKTPSFGQVLGVLYGWNTFGAVAGVLGGELFLIKFFGLRGAGLMAACLNLTAASIVFIIYKKQKNTQAATTTPIAGKFIFSRVIIRVLGASFFSGFILLALEVIWFRFLVLFFIATSLNFSIMLTMVLLGISAGGLIAGKLYRRYPDAHRFLVPVLAFNGILIILLYTNFNSVYYASLGLGNNLQLVLAALFLIFPVSFISGTIFIMLGKKLHEQIPLETSASGFLTVANTTGGMVGSLVAGMVLIPYLGIEKSFFALALGYGVVISLLYSRQKQENSPRTKVSLDGLLIGTFLLCLVIFPFGFMHSKYLRIPVAPFLAGGEKLMVIREGLTETIQYLQKDIFNKSYYHRLVTNSHSMSSTGLKPKRYMKLFVYLPTAIHPGVEDALLICFGCGSTAKALTDTKSLKNIEIVDISRDIIKESQVVFPDPRENPVYDPRVKNHVEDGRFFLLTRERKFDLITAEPPPPSDSGIVNLYTQEYFQLIYDRLKEGGVVTYWLPVYQLSVAESKSILKGFCNVFKESSLWKGSGYEWMMVGVKNPQKAVSVARFSRQWVDPVVAAEMQALGFASPEQLGAFFIADGPRLQEWISASLPLIDNYPQRLSSDVKIRPDGEYLRFMASNAAKENFMNSPSIAKIWPAELREKTGAYFAAAHIINELVTPPEWRQYTTSSYLHQCLTDPLLARYALWVLGSDLYAQNILTRFLAENPRKKKPSPEMFIHLASAALQNRDFPLVEYYLNLQVSFGMVTHSLNDFSSFDLCTVRLYLLYLSGKKAQAPAVVTEYLNYVRNKSGQAEMEKLKGMITQYLNWLEQNFK